MRGLERCSWMSNPADLDFVDDVAVFILDEDFFPTRWILCSYNFLHVLIFVSAAQSRFPETR